MEARIPEGEPLYMATAELLDWSKGDTDEIYAFKVVRAARYDSLAAELASEREAGLGCFEDKVKLEAGLRKLIHDYVCLLESARDRIKMLGGECDDVPTMERGDPALIRAKALLTPAQRRGDDHG